MGGRSTGAKKPWSKWRGDTEQAFLLALRLTGQVSKAAEEIGRSRSSCQTRRRTNPEFARAWDAAIAGQQQDWIVATRARLGPGLDGTEEEASGGRLTPWRDRANGWDARKRGLFLRTLARGKNVAEACRAAGMSDSAAYYLRGQSPRFAAAWEKALRAEACPSVLEAALERGVNGWVEPIVAGGRIVGERRRFSDGLLRELLRQEHARETRAEAARKPDPREPWRPRPRSLEEVRDSILRKVEAIRAMPDPEEEERQAAEELRRRACWGAFGRPAAEEEG